MRVTQEDERTYKVRLSDEELSDLKAEAKVRELTPLEIMKAVFFMMFVQIVSCFWRRAILGHSDKGKIPESQKDTVDFMPNGV